MFGGVGIPSAKGTGTNGYVERALGYLPKDYKPGSYGEIIRQMKANPAPIKRKINDDKSLEYFLPSILGISILLVLVIELALKHKNRCISEKTLLIILLILNSINNVAIAIIYNFSKEFIFYLMNGLSLIISNIMEKYSTHFFEYIIPHNYIICKMQGNTFINIIATLSRIIAAALAMGSSIYIPLIIYILIAILSIISTILYFVFYSDIRIKSISRIITKQDKDQMKIATGI